MDEELRQALKDLEHRIEGKIDALGDRVLGLVREMIESSETKLLTQFQKRLQGLRPAPSPSLPSLT